MACVYSPQLPGLCSAFHRSLSSASCASIPVFVSIRAKRTVSQLRHYHDTHPDSPQANYELSVLTNTLVWHWLTMPRKNEHCSLLLAPNSEMICFAAGDACVPYGFCRRRCCVVSGRRCCSAMGLCSEVRRAFGGDVADAEAAFCCGRCGC